MSWMDGGDGEAQPAVSDRRIHACWAAWNMMGSSFLSSWPLCSTQEVTQSRGVAVEERGEKPSVLHASKEAYLCQRRRNKR